MDNWRWAGAAFACVFVQHFTGAAVGAESRSCVEYAGEVVSTQGSVEFRNGGGWQAVALHQALCDQEAVRTGPESRAAIRLTDNAVLRLDENTTLVLSDVAPEPEKPSFLELVIGAIQSFSRDPQTLEVDTPYVNATVEGTEFALRVIPGESTLTVIEGQVLASNEFGSARVASGGAAVTAEGKAPQSVTIVRPRDAVAWGLYYPPTLSQSEGAAAPALAEAAHLLSVGQAEDAGALLDSLLSAEPDNGIALAQAAVVDIVRNDQAAGLEKAERAVAAAPDKAAPYIALSYAQQSAFRLEEARDTLLAGSEAVPESALMAVRLSEIWLALGYRDRSGAAADQALALDAQLARAYVMKGFAALTEFRTAAARELFEQAIELDSADPLPRLGLGLAKIRDGELAAGRGEIDAAVALDSNRSLLRSYLGKAYFEEDRNVLADEQLKIAKELDPLDPTPYLYDAIRLQTENRPVEALAAIRESIERNDNRAVYRGRLQLDEDRAARGASLARVYEDLGFHQLGVNEASNSLALAPDNASAHRFLADSLTGFRSREISRVSEQLQAKMLQDININPVSPSSTIANLSTNGGTGSAGFNEYTALFERNQAQLNISGGYGTDDTWFGESVVSGVHDWLSLSAGAYHYETDGWRTNNDIEHDVQNVYLQAAVTPELNIQAEYRHRETDQGNLEFEFSEARIFPNERRETESDTGRIGLRWSPAPHSDLLFTYIRTNRDFTLTDFDSVVLAPSVLGFDFGLDRDADQYEGQYIFKRERFNVVAGAAINRIDADNFVDITIDGVSVGPPFPILEKTEITDDRGYVYANLNFPSSVTWTVGVNYVDFEDPSFANNSVEEIDPKFGVHWDVLRDLTFRAAYIETVKPPVVSNQTLEPTQVAGFNQFFDGVNGTESEYFAAALDWQALDSLALGVEISKRDIADPFINSAVFPAELVIDDANEEIYRAYAYWTPTDRIAVRAAFVLDKWERESDDLTILLGSQLPLDVETISVPLNATYFHPSGFFAGAGVTYVDQKVRKQPGLGLAQGNENFTLVDFNLGYRLPNRRGIASLEIRNLFNEDFVFQDDTFRARRDDVTVSPYIPGQAIMARLMLKF